MLASQSLTAVGLLTLMVSCRPPGDVAATIAATSPGGLQDTIKVNSPTAVNDWLANINSNLVQTAGQLTFNLKGTDSDGKLVFIPHYSRYKDRYGIYWIM